MNKYNIVDYRDPKGRYAKKSRQKGNTKIVILLIVLAIIGILYFKAKGQNIEPWQLNDTVKVSQNDEGLTAEQKANLEKQYQLSKQETAAMNKKDAQDSAHKTKLAQLKSEYDASVDAENTDYNTKNTAIEGQLESIREQQTSFK